jgi:hypothetical protein
MAVALLGRHAVREAAVERVRVGGRKGEKNVAGDMRAGSAGPRQAKRNPPRQLFALSLRGSALARTSAKAGVLFCRYPADRISGQKHPEKVRQFQRSRIPPESGPSPCLFPAMACQKARKTAFSSPYLWPRLFHKHLFMQRNRSSTARLAALTGRSAACVFAGLGVTSRNAVRTGGVFLNGGIGGGAGRAVTVA